MKRSPVIYILFAFWLLCIHCVLAVIKDPNPLNEVDNRRFYVELTAETKDSEAVALQQKNFLTSLDQLHLPYKVGTQYTLAWNALLLEIDEPKEADKLLKEDLEKIHCIAGVKDIYPEQRHSSISARKTPHDYGRYLRKRQNSIHNNEHIKHYNGYAADPLAPNKMTGVQVVHQTTNLTGYGIKVGVIDSGIDYQHPALGGCFGPGCRVAYGYDFVGDDGHSPDSDPIDKCFGHGTLCAGIIGGLDPNGPWHGVAKNVIFGAYRVTPCSGNLVQDSDVVAAIEMALKDGMDILSISIGETGWAESASAAVTYNAARIIPVIASLGNDGEKGWWTASSPSVSYDVISVGSVNNDVISEFYISNNVDSNYLIRMYSTPAQASNIYLPLYASVFNAFIFEAYFISKYATEPVSTAKNVPLLDISEICAGPNGTNLNVSGKALLVNGVVCFGGKFSFADAYKNGAVVVLRYMGGEQDRNIFDAALGVVPGLPILQISNVNGEWLANELKSHSSVTITFSEEQKAFPMVQAGKPSSFSSWGLSSDLDIKPDILAPGSKILSTFPLNMGGWAQDTGTSIATPYVTGSIALILEKYGKLSPAKIRSLIMNTAIPMHMYSGLLYPVAKQGSGLINVYDALNAKTLVTPTKYSLNNNSNFENVTPQQRYNLTILNQGDAPVRYTLSHLPAASVTGYNSTNTIPLENPIVANITSTITFSETTVLIAPKTSATITWTIQPPILDLSVPWIYSGFILIKPDSGEQAQSIPYAGLLHLGTINVLGHPQLNSTSVVGFTGRDDAVTITLWLENPTRVLVIGAQSADNVTDFGVALVERYQNRAIGSDEAKFVMNGSVGVGEPDPVTGKFAQYKPLANGEYRYYVKALKLFGDLNNLGDFEKWVSKPFTISRPKIA
ncbi:peptidase S8/S53 domain-containing protein [Jimgerdemannia flammicorona]|uniref:Peptidase S8/S53 domain-containing protein n=1 Tax=Jimgerdemannia flammicorona TaxID=994334 RepID=A0A433QLD2_9FUNG|nr:peptidase S8/S53 domain-containing protein [Jimgerdemannia flammicorona]